MKHTKFETIILLAWLLVSIVIGLSFARIAEPISFGGFGGEDGGLSIIIIAIAVILLGTLMWMTMLKLKPKHVPLIFSFGMGALYGSLLGDFLIPTQNIFARGAMLFGSWVAYYIIIRKIRNTKWAETKRWIHLNNLIMICGIGFVAAQFAATLKPWVAILFFALVAIYDAIAVWKLKSMQKMAIGLIDLGIIPGIAVGKRTKKQGYALLGGGDIFFLVVVAGSMVRYSPGMAITTAIGIFTSIVLLFVNSQRKKFYPALPFMFVGMVAGILAWWVTGLVF
jgi:presenilin-like A22 family membrane protease